MFEGIIDALSLYELEEKDNVVALLGGINRPSLQKLRSIIGQKLILVFDNDISGALSRWDLEESNLDFKPLNFVPEAENIYKKIRKNFPSLKEASDYLKSEEGKNDPEYRSRIKDMNDYLVEMRKIKDG